jgi:hypothetical protein
MIQDSRRAKSKDKKGLTATPSPEVNLLERVASDFFGPHEDIDFIKHRLKAHLWSGQELIHRALSNHRYVAVPSAHDVGKTFFAAALACEWIEEHEDGEAFVVSTAPTTPQVTAALWRNIEKFHRTRSLKGRITMGRIPEWKIGKMLVGYGRKPADYDETGFQGIHETYPLIIIDEAAGIPPLLWTAVDALATNENARVLAIGNPDDAHSTFAAICAPGSGWYVVRLDGLASPNFTEEEVKAASGLKDELGHPLTGNLYEYFVDNQIPFSKEKVPFALRQELLSPRWVGERMVGWGVHKTPDEIWITSALWEARVRGRFPTKNTEGLIPYSWIDQAIQRYKALEASQESHTVESIIGPRVFGVDVARTGADQTVVARRVNNVVLGFEKWTNQDTQVTAHRVAHRLDAYLDSRAMIDVVNVGAGTVDRLRELDYDVTAFNGQAGTDARDRSSEFGFTNTRSAAWYNLRELLDPSRPDCNLCLPEDDEMIADLTAPTWRVMPGGKIAVERKEDVKKRLRRSPDTGDALAMCLWQMGADMGEAIVVPYGGESPYVQSFTPTETEYVSGISEFEVPVAAMAGWGELLMDSDANDIY